MKKVKTSHLHSFECDIEEEISVLYKYFPKKGLKNKILRFYLSKIIVSESNRVSRFYFRSKASIEREKLRQLGGENHLFVIHPFSQFWTKWILFINCITAFSIYELPVRVSFNYIRNGSIKHSIWMWMGFVLDIVYLINIVLNFFVGYLLEGDSEVVEINPWRIARNYLKLGFLIDIISSVPMDVIYYLMVNDFSGTAEKVNHFILNTFHLIKILRVASFGMYVLRTSQIYGVSRFTPYRIVATYAASLVLHMAACTQFMTFVIRYYNNEEMQSWVTVDNLWDRSTFCVYFYALHRGTALALGGNFSHAEAFSLGETILAVLTRIAGSLMFAVFIGHCVHIIGSAHRSKRESADNIKRQLQSYLTDKRVPNALKKKAMEYFDFRFPESYYEHKEVEEALSKSLIQDIVQYQAKTMEEKVPLFRGLPTKLLTDIVSRMTTEHFWPNDVIIQANTIGDNMFFLSRGTVAVFTPTGKEICHLQDGAHFGEIALIKRSKRTASVMAVEPCEIFCLTRDDFKEVVNPESALWQSIAAEAELRMEKLERTEQQMRRTAFHGSGYEKECDD